MSMDIVLRAVDNNTKILFEYSVPFSLGASVKQVMEAAFVLNQQAPPNEDPFLYAVEYYGYSEDPQLPGYLGYEVEGIGTQASGMLSNNANYYWELLINKQPSKTGADTTYPGPGSLVLWQYSAMPPGPNGLTARARVVRARRIARKAASVS